MSPGAEASGSGVEITCACPHCKQRAELNVPPGGSAPGMPCPACGEIIPLAIPPVFRSAGTIDRCLVCPERHLYRQKDFNQSVGCVILGIGSVIGLILAGMYGALWLWGVLAVTALLDGLLYRIVPEVVICYRCKAHYREMPDNPEIKGFDLQLADAIEGRMGGGFQAPSEPE